jgi:O-methyltransferase involved in polyketide biosynthesis
MIPGGSNPDGGPRKPDESTPNSARLYDYYLGGAHNFAADRELAEQILTAAPTMRGGARANRAFLQRAVTYLVKQGIEQFLDLGSGIPTVGNVHEIAQGLNPSARVVYVDYEPVAYQAAADMLAGTSNSTVIQADLRDPRAVLRHPETTALLDFARPVAVLMVGVLVFLSDEDRPAELIATYRDALAPGSYLALNNPSTDAQVATDDSRAEVSAIESGYEQATENFHVRDQAEIASWFAGTTLVEPGLVPFNHWRNPDPVSDTIGYGYAGVARVPD